MDIRFSDEENAFRAEVRAFLQQAWTPELAARIDDDASYPQAIVEWQWRLFERGWVAPGWPKSYGGCEWTPDAALHLRNRALGRSARPTCCPSG